MKLTGKVALITGGASGIAKGCAEEFLKNNIKGIVIADINANLGEEAAKNFNERFGQGKATFVKTDVSDKDSFEKAFQKAVETYNNIDILVNAAAIFDEINWERLLNINVVGSTNGCVLAINKYFPKYKSSFETYVINFASITSFVPLGYAPHYTTSKYAIIGLTRSYGINKTTANQGVCVMALCPGSTDTPMLQNSSPEKVLYVELIEEELGQFVTQKVEAVSQCLMQILSKPENGSIWLINDSVLSKVNVPSLEEMITNAS